MAVRVAQWTTGNVGQRSIRAVVAHPELELVGGSTMFGAGIKPGFA